MVVKWVCSRCGSNNMSENAFLLSCEVCGKARISEPLNEVDTAIVDTSEVQSNSSPRKLRSIRALSAFLLIKGKFLQWISIFIVICFIAIGLISGFGSNLPLEIVFARISQNAGSLLQMQKITSAVPSHWPVPTESLSALSANLQENLSEALVKTAWSGCLTNMYWNTFLIKMHIQGFLQALETNSHMIIHHTQQLSSEMISSVKSMTDNFLQMF